MIYFTFVIQSGDTSTANREEFIDCNRRRTGQTLVDRVLNHLLEIDRVRASEHAMKDQQKIGLPVAHNCSDIPCAHFSTGDVAVSPIDGRVFRLLNAYVLYF